MLINKYMINNIIVLMWNFKSSDYLAFNDLATKRYSYYLKISNASESKSKLILIYYCIMYHLSYKL